TRRAPPTSARSRSSRARRTPTTTSRVSTIASAIRPARSGTCGRTARCASVEIAAPAVRHCAAKEGGPMASRDAERNAMERRSGGGSEARIGAIGAGCAAALLAVGLASGAATAQQDEMPNPGRDAYRQYGASCRGVDGGGGGPMAAVLRTASPDLSRLGERFGSPLNTQRLIERIDGR